MLTAGNRAGLSDHTPVSAENRALGILLDDPRAGRPVHVEHIPARSGQHVPWPQWGHPALRLASISPRAGAGRKR